ncbi:hypothetical protein [Aurantiacibacter spongiae]|uniref:Uncharacterized protein n=1 Tax=Aurantiacibacter spongiae TaxID=2488860 RepID=A0A3N5D7E3_9SPHN|nr:hypothetical protein [Aurantiacibacter spongiae]RPF70448.1 hypothetical protein EG799_01495 [Aurantiacibacter spongiae]
MSTYPRMMYRPGTMLEDWHGQNVDWKIVDDEREEQAALKEGWNVSPDCSPQKAETKRGASKKKVTQ